ncbi:DUF397 domain-containing protein [Streptomyces sp. MMCC 100]|uniref:DUF397 domain-containing protein n=1 Tax=Streptomyces sp. MMCC 100 TaxID=3163555 RepID=UPI00359842DF
MDAAPSPRNIRWRKSSYSGNTGGECVEVGENCSVGSVPVRDSKNPDGPVVTVAAPAWQSFIQGLR